MKLSSRISTLSGLVVLFVAVLATGVYAQNRTRGDFTHPHGIAFKGMGMDGAAGRAFGRGSKGMSGFNMDSPMQMMAMAKRLDLSEKQRDEIGKTIDNLQPKMRETGFKLMDSQEEIRALMQSDSISDKKLRSVTKEQGELMAEMMYLRMKMQSDIKAALNEEQLEKLQNQRSRFRGRSRKAEKPQEQQ